MSATLELPPVQLNGHRPSPTFRDATMNNSLDNDISLLDDLLAAAIRRLAKPEALQLLGCELPVLCEVLYVVVVQH